MSKLRKPSPLVPLPSTYVHSVLSKVGLACGAAFSDRPATSTPFWSHALADYAMTLVGWKGLFIGYTHGVHKSIRKRALRKKERDAKKQ
jgi:17beta-estradiol 17-dehydrogenase / very-long-chain 3-oxoacyl-CoA reductase